MLHAVRRSSGLVVTRAVQHGWTPLPCVIGRHALAPRCLSRESASQGVVTVEQEPEPVVPVAAQEPVTVPTEPVLAAAPAMVASEPSVQAVEPAEKQSAQSRLLSLALPLVVQNIFGYSALIVAMGFVGALGSEVLAAYSLAASIYNVCGLSVALGLSTGMDTLAGSAYGAREYGKLGLILQRAVIVCWGACVPVALAWFNAESLLVALGQDPEISHLAGKFLVLWIPTLFANVLSECIKRFLQAQRLVRILAVSGLVGVVSAPLWYYATMTLGGLGMVGSAIASALTQFTILSGVLGYTIWRCRQLGDAPEQPWRGFQLRAAASGWREYLTFGLPAAMMICLEWWVYEAVVIMAGWIPDAGVTIACMGICTSLNAWAYMVPLGLAAGVNTSVSNALGAGDGPQAASVFHSGLKMGLALQACMAGVMLTAGPMLVPMLCPDPAVQQLTASVLPILSCVLVADGLNAVVSGTLRGAGRQRLGAVVNGVCCALSIPLAWLLALKLGLGAHGFWMGVGAGSFTQLAILLTILMRARRTAGLPGGAAAGGVLTDGAKSSPGGASAKPGASTAVQTPWWGWDWQAEAARLQGVATQPAPAH